MTLTHLSLFSGIGGIDLAAEWAGFETIAFVECNDYAQKVLRKHWPDVPILEDVRNVTKEQFKEPITLITGGVPCQPASVAGKRRGKEDDRWLWPEAIRILSEIKTTWAVFENPTGILTLEDGVVFNDLLSGMEAEGYEVQPVIVPACAVNAPHRRDRCFIVAHNNTIRCDMWRIGREGIQRGSEPCCEVRTGSQDVADPERTKQQSEWGETWHRRDISGCGSWWTTQSSICRVASGLPEGLDSSRWDREWEGVPRVATGVKNRVDRLRCLGNAVVPQQIYPILKAIADIERGNHANT